MLDTVAYQHLGGVTVFTGNCTQKNLFCVPLFQVTGEFSYPTN